jgi:phytoene synthase
MMRSAPDRTEHARLERLCRDAIRRGSKSFSAASRLLDPETRSLSQLLYAWCRHCDDVIDGQDHGYAAAPDDAAASKPREQLEALRVKTRAALAGRGEEPVFAALGHVCQVRSIPARYPFDLLDGFAMDVAGRRYDTMNDTLTYCYHVAGSVGVMMAMVMGTRELDALDRASDLGIAFQLTNIARDVAADAAVGRVYLPESWLAMAGLDRDDVGDPMQAHRVAAVVKDVLDLADTYYASASYGLRHLPPRSAWAVVAARDVYRGISEEVRRRGAAAWTERVVVPRRRKVRLIAQAGLAVAASRLWPGRPPESPRSGLWTMSHVDA